MTQHNRHGGVGANNLKGTLTPFFIVAPQSSSQECSQVSGSDIIFQCNV